MKKSRLWGLRDGCVIGDFNHLDLDEVTWGCGRVVIIRHQDLGSGRRNRRLWTLIIELSSVCLHLLKHLLGLWRWLSG